jgi:hypothetical protein
MPLGITYSMLTKPAGFVPVHQEEHHATVLAAVILVLLLGALVSAPYAKWRGSAHPQDQSVTGA